ncbi:cellulose biosynthesis protein BcsN [Pseudoxanthobacter sp. M-2]|uniref:cellulose biosynthesis protein BcsN n=1 Tax=Pseudoxanthobacter sp. M-2 TaxID=3078754 RepID=UPI0038FC5DAA
MRLVLALIGASLLSGCNLPPPYFGAGQDPKTATLLQEVPPTAALVLPPPGSLAVVTVLERRYANALTQTVVLANDSTVSGENAIEVTFFGPVGPGAAQGDTLRWRPLDPVRVSNEMIEKFPGVRMTRSPYFVQNGYGPFGYGVGHPRGGGTCLYAWQQIEPPRNKFGEPKSRGSISLRVRLCRAAASEEDLLRFMYGLVISGYFLPAGWNPYGPAPSPPADLGGLGAPSLPVPEGENPYYAPRSREPRELRVLPAAPAATTAVRRPAPVEPEVSPYLTAPAARTPAPQSLDQPLGTPSALPPAAAPSSSGIPAPAATAGGSGGIPAPPPSAAGTALPRPTTIPTTLPGGTGAATVPPPISSATTPSQSMTVTRPQPPAGAPDVRVVAPGAPATAGPSGAAPAIVPPPPQ